MAVTRAMFFIFVDLCVAFWVICFAVGRESVFLIYFYLLLLIALLSN